MNEKMQVIFIKQTGHVLAAFTRGADPEGKPSIDTLIGEGLMLRNSNVMLPSVATNPKGETLLVSSDSLDVAVVDLDPDVFFLHSSFAAGGGKVELLGNSTPSSTLANDKLTITTTNAPPSDLKIWAQVEKVKTAIDTDRVTRVMEGVIEKTKTSADLVLTISLGGPAATLPSGQYYLLALVEGQRPFFTTKSLP